MCSGVFRFGRFGVWFFSVSLYFFFNIYSYSHTPVIEKARLKKNYFAAGAKGSEVCTGVSDSIEEDGSGAPLIIHSKPAHSRGRNGLL